MKKKLFAAAAALSVCCCMGGMSASAITPDDVAARARASGWPEEVIQMGYNEWASGRYNEEKLQIVYNKVSAWDDEMAEMVYGAFGMDPPAKSPDPEPAAPETTPASPAETTPSGSAGGSGSGGAGTAGTGGSPSGGAGTANPGGTGGSPSGDTGKKGGTLGTVTKKDGTVEDRIPPADFVDMTFEEKQAYVDSLTEESKKAFVADLTKEERNSMLKQMPVEDKAALMQTYIDVAEEMGVSVSVDSLTEDNLSVTIRDENGKVIDKAAVGITIDETGISHTRPLLFAVGGSLLAVLGFGGLYYYIRKTEE